jgi:hypothetical protein
VACQNGRGAGDGRKCADSEFLVEGWRHACGWILFRKEAPPTGPEPYFTGSSPGQGCAGRA